MVKLQKKTIPNSLAQHSGKWTKDLMFEYEAQGSDSSKVADRFWNKYRKDDIKAALEAETYGKCIYCDAKIGSSDFEHIEHIKPKKLNPKLTYDWNNLGWCCGICNQKKGEYTLLNPYEVDFESVLEITHSFLFKPKDPNNPDTAFFIARLELNDRAKLLLQRSTNCRDFEKKIEQLRVMKEKRDPLLYRFIEVLKIDFEETKEFYMFKKYIFNTFVKIHDIQLS
ncbi:retron system putative HNH endonuclease [Carnobacterium mobile]|uniref:retron system putative HNH endonuclease n=1 Tax=Carnobacterium mobile TaxID=2750 RepID=UPI0018679872|nr:retron system putative HNH endonuclease [Carnobacterium mobile]